MTLIELLVAMAVLSLLIVGVGMVFSATSKMIRVTTSRADINAAVRGVQPLLATDLRGASSGVLAICAPGGSVGAGRSAMLLIARLGHYVSACHRNADGSPVTANAAVIVYLVARDEAGRGVLCRYQYLLTGREDLPFDLLDLVNAAAGADDPLASSDVLGESLVDLRLRRYFPGLWAYGADSFDVDYMRVLRDHPPRVNLSPDRMDDPADGGVAQLWPVLIGGAVEVQGMDIRFCDGYDNAGVASDPGIMDWIDVKDSERRTYHRIQRFRMANPYRMIYWMFEDSEALPDGLTRTPPEIQLTPEAIEVTLKLASPRSEDKASEFRLILPTR